MNIVDVERAKYDKVWLYPEYRLACHSLKLWQERRELFPLQGRFFTSAIDIGCGLGLLIDEWNNIGIDACGVDISTNSVSSGLVNSHKVVYACLWEMEWDRVFDFGICTDVMEHIPQHKVGEVLRRIGYCCREVLFKIAHEPNELGGEVLHLTLQPYQWWIDCIHDVGLSLNGGNSHVEYLGYEIRSGCQDSLIRWKMY